jgi:Predicted transcriptional regulators
MDMKDIYTIGDLVKELKINKETIRYYERIGLLSEPKRDSNRYRLYTINDVEMIRFIRIAKGFGFTLSEISTLLHNEILSGNIEDIRRVVTNKISEIDVKIYELSKTRKLLEKVKETITSNNLENCNGKVIDLEN